MNRHRWLSGAGLAVGVLLLGAPGVAAQHIPLKARTATALLGELPPVFVENAGQMPGAAAFVVKGRERTLYFTERGVLLALEGGGRRHVLQLDFLGARPVRPVGEDRQAAVFSWFKGTEPSRWRRGIGSWGRVVYRGLWPGIDLVWTAEGHRLKYHFLVAVGADPNRIALRWQGADVVRVDSSGALRVETPLGALVDEPPVAWQVVDGRRTAVEAGWCVEAEDAEAVPTVRFRLGMHDPARLLVIDPAVLVYCGYIGGSSVDGIYGLSVDPQGNLLIAGATHSPESSFPVTVGPDLTYGKEADAFVAKVTATGDRLVYCGYLGGAGQEEAIAVALDSAGAAYVVGRTSSDEQTLPVRHGPDLTYNGFRDVLVAKVRPDGTGLVYCGYVGGEDYEQAQAAAVDRSGNLSVGGLTRSTEKTFPVRVGPDLTINDAPYSNAGDAFVAKIALTLLEATGTPSPGSRIDFTVTATDDVGYPYQMASSFSTGPIAIDTRQIDLGYDGLLWISVSGLVPEVFTNYRGYILQNGTSPASLNLPAIPATVGLKIHTAFVTLDPQAPSGIKSISNTFSFQVTK